LDLKNGERSRRRVRDLVTHLAFEGRSQNETERARISMMARSDLLHTRAGYRSARPTIAILKIQLATRGRSIQMGHVGAAKRSVYCMTKHAIEGLTKAMAIELATHNIRVNAVAPTIVETSMTAAFLQDASYRQFAMDTIPMKRIAEPQDVAEAVVYLASPAARLVTGTSLRVDGGATAQ